MLRDVGGATIAQNYEIYLVAEKEQTETSGQIVFPALPARFKQLQNKDITQNTPAKVTKKNKAIGFYEQIQQKQPI